MKPLQVAFVWHMHQPYYKDDLTNTYLLPWVRLRSAKDYFKMPALLDAYPKIRATFNLVPSLLAQIEDYGKEESVDLFLNLSKRDAAELTAEERAFIIRWMRESPRALRVQQSPRYLELASRAAEAEGSRLLRSRQGSALRGADGGHGEGHPEIPRARRSRPGRADLLALLPPHPPAAGARRLGPHCQSADPASRPPLLASRGRAAADRAGPGSVRAPGGSASHRHVAVGDGGGGERDRVGDAREPRVDRKS